MNLFEKLLAKTGLDAPPNYTRRSGYRNAVSYSSEFRRIERLPRRDWREALLRLPEQSHIIHSEVCRPDGKMALWPVQVAALIDICIMKGAFLPIGVGQGKALISLLSPIVLEAKRPVLFVPAQLREQTNDYVIPEMRHHWRLHPDLVVVGYSELSLAKNADMLERLQPDLIILDECHRVKNKKAGRTRRMVRWFKEHPDTMCVAMSGTVSNRSIKDFAHIIRWCLKEHTPVPVKWTELSDWADALDEKVPEDKRVQPGALLRLCAPGENPRQGFRRRLTQTPGVVATKEGELSMSLQISRFPGPEVPGRVHKLIHDLRTEWMTPNGDMIAEAVELWRHVRELALGFWYRWDPPAPREWMDARKEWKKYVRETLRYNQRGLDTEFQVWTECQTLFKHNSLPPNHPWINWRDEKDSFVPNTVPEWVDKFALGQAIKWLESCTNEEPGICWVEHLAFGVELAKHSGFPYYGAGDSGILAATSPAVIASIQAHAEGKNLQRYCRNLITAPMTSGKAWEQLLGRTHRQGQEADEVTCEIFLHQPELVSSFSQALADARYLEDTFGNRQKLNYADYVADAILKNVLTHCAVNVTSKAPLDNPGNSETPSGRERNHHESF